MKVIGIDYGASRIGIAASDDAGIMAHPVKTVKIGEEETPADVVPQIVSVVEEKEAEIVVVGMPFHMDGSEGDAVEAVEAWVEQLSDALPDAAIEMVDERLTTVVAQTKLREAGISSKDSKDIIDQVAAVEILQSYLEAQQQAAEEEIGRGGADPELAAFRLDDDDDEDDFDYEDYSGGGQNDWDVDGHNDDY